MLKEQNGARNKLVLSELLDIRLLFSVKLEHSVEITADLLDAMHHCTGSILGFKKHTHCLCRCPVEVCRTWFCVLKLVFRMFRNGFCFPHYWYFDALYDCTELCMHFMECKYSISLSSSGLKERKHEIKSTQASVLP